jgi:hypothetical protein
MVAVVDAVEDARRVDTRGSNIELAVPRCATRIQVPACSSRAPSRSQ